jgi:hypothetical protein
MRALQRNPATRFADAKAMQSALAECIAPNTPSALADQLSSYLQTTFAENIKIEHVRTRVGTENALKQWHSEDTMELEELLLDSPESSKVSKYLLMMAALSIGLWGGYQLFQEDSIVEREEVLVVSPRSLMITVEPSSAAPEIWINGKQIDGRSITLGESNLKEPILLKIKAEGFKDWEHQINVGLGVEHHLHVMLHEDLDELDLNFQEPVDNQNQ